MGRKVTTKKVGQGRKVVVIDMDSRPCETCSLLFDWIKSVRFGVIQRFTFFICVFALGHGVTFTYLASQVTTLEKIFGFSSTESGLILSSYDWGFIMTGIFVGHFAHKLHRPRMIAASAFFVGMTTMLIGLAHYIFSFDSKNQYVNSGNGTVDHLHNVTTTKMTLFSPCSKETALSADASGMTSSLTYHQSALAIFIVCFALAGAGPTAIWTLGMSYIDDNTQKEKASFLIGTTFAVRMTAPVVGFLMGSVTSSLPVDFQATTISPKAPNWIGAWWVGFIACGALSLLCTVPLLLFPKEIIPEYESTRERISRLTIRSQKASMKGMPSVLLRLMKNPIYMPLALATVFQVASAHGYSIFLPKYLQTQFHVCEFVSNAIVAIAMPLTSAVGCTLGGFLTSRVKMSINQMCLLSLLMIVIATLMFPLLLLFECPSTPMKSLESTHGAQAQTFSAGCRCSVVNYEPVCGDDYINYYSPCHAGCQGFSNSKDNIMFTNCRAVGTETKQAIGGSCDTECLMVVAYVVMLVVPVFMTSLAQMPWVLLSMRCIPEEDKSLGLGFITFLISFIAIPIPILYGFFIDKSCLIFKPGDPFGSRQYFNCLQYDSGTFRVRFHLVTFALSCVQPIFLFITWLNARKTIFPSKQTAETDKQSMARIVRRSSDAPTYKESYSVTSM